MTCAANSRIALALTAIFLTMGSGIANAVDARVAEVERALRPAVSILGEERWTLEERMRHYGVPGVAITVIDDGGVAWTRVYGFADRESGTPMNEQTLLQAASISKPVAAVGAMILVEAGTLSLDQPVNERLTSWKIPDNDFTTKVPVTLAHLLSHTGGLTVHGFSGYAAGAPVPNVAQILNGEPPSNSAPVRVDQLPGSAWRYSGGGYTVAQLLMSEVVDAPFEALMQRSVLVPAGMQQSTFENPLPAGLLQKAAAGVLPDGSAVLGKRHTYPEMAAAGLWTTSADLARFILEVQKALRGDSKLLNASTAKSMLEPRLSDYGLGFGLPRVNGEAYFGHNGWDEGFCALLVAHQSKGVGVAIMINANQPQLMEEIKRAVAFTYGWPGYVEHTSRPIAKSVLDSVAGRYRYNAEQVIEIAADAGRLYLTYVGDQRMELVAVGENRYLRRERDSAISFQTGEADQRELAFELPDGALQRHPRIRNDDRLPRELLLADEAAAALDAYTQLKDAGNEAAGEDYLNREGMGLVQRGRFEAAIKLLTLNTQLYPTSANTWDSLGYAYLIQDNKSLARENYRKALSIDPDFASAKQALEKLGE